MFTWWERTDVTINGGEIIGNSAGSGGGIACGGNFTQTGTSVIARNSASDDGGGLTLGGFATLEGAEISDNTAGRDGGGLALGGRATFEGVKFHNNTAGRDGGGVHFAGSTVNATLVNSVLVHNQASRWGSGLYIGGGPHRFVHTTIAGNLGGDGSGIHVAGEDSTVALTNTILVSHTVGISVAAGNTATLNATLWGAGTWANLDDWGGAGAIHTDTNLWGDPAFVDPDAKDYHIRRNSVAVDAGVDSGISKDIDGDPRPMGYGYDLGADEFPMWSILSSDRAA